MKHDFQKQIQSRRKMFKLFFYVNLIIVFALAVFVSIAIYSAISNPEGIGEFFGKIVKGFNSQK